MLQAVIRSGKNAEAAQKLAYSLAFVTVMESSSLTDGVACDLLTSKPRIRCCVRAETTVRRARLTRKSKLTDVSWVGLARPCQNRSAAPETSSGCGVYSPGFSPHSRGVGKTFVGLLSCNGSNAQRTRCMVARSGSANILDIIFFLSSDRKSTRLNS